MSTCPGHLVGTAEFICQDGAQSHREVKGKGDSGSACQRREREGCHCAARLAGLWNASQRVSISVDGHTKVSLQDDKCFLRPA